MSSSVAPVELPDSSGRARSLEENYAIAGRVSRAGRVRRRLTSPWATIAALIIAVLWTVPTFGLFVSSFRPEQEIKTTGWWTLFENWGLTLDNYSEVLFSASSSAPQLGQYFVNSLAISIPATVFPLVIASMAAYAFAWMKWRGRDVVFVLVFALQIVPLQMALIPLLQLFSQGMTINGVTIVPEIPQGGYTQLWLAHTMFALPLAIFLLYNFVSQIPGEVVEAARVDGASHSQIFVRIILPLAMPAIASFAIFQFLWVWNDLLVALVFSGGTPEVAPLTQRLAELTGSRGNEWQRLTAAAFVSLAVPLIVFFGLQRYFVRGLLAGSTKG